MWARPGTFHPTSNSYQVEVADSGRVGKVAAGNGRPIIRKMASGKGRLPSRSHAPYPKSKGKGTGRNLKASPASIQPEHEPSTRGGRGDAICTYIGQEMFVVVDIGCHGGSGWNMTKTRRPARKGKSHGPKGDVVVAQLVTANVIKWERLDPFAH